MSLGNLESNRNAGNTNIHWTSMTTITPSEWQWQIRSTSQASPSTHTQWWSCCSWHENHVPIKPTKCFVKRCHSILPQPVWRRLNTNGTLCTALKAAGLWSCLQMKITSSEMNWTKCDIWERFGSRSSASLHWRERCFYMKNRRASCTVCCDLFHNDSSCQNDPEQNVFDAHVSHCNGLKDTAVAMHARPAFPTMVRCSSEQCSSPLVNDRASDNWSHVLQNVSSVNESRVGHESWV